MSSVPMTSTPITLSPFRAVRGIPFKKRDVQEWNEKTYLTFFDIVHRFTVTKGLTESIAVTSEALMKFEEEAFRGNQPFYEEVIARINQVTTDPRATIHKFYQSFTATVRLVGAYIREHPSVVTEAMRESMEKNPRLAWMLTHYTRKETKMGASLIIPQKFDNVNSEKAITKNPDPNMLILESTMKLSDILNTLTSSLTKKELRDLSAKDKLSQATSILKTLAALKSYKPNIGVFNQININAAGRDELEEAMLDMGRAKE